MGNTAHGLPYPEGTDNAADGDNAIRALAEAVDAAINYKGWVPGVWQDTPGMTICTDTSLATKPGAAVSMARAMRIGNTVWYIGYGSSGTAAGTVAMSLPNALMGVPARREYNCGTAVSTGASQPAQAGVGFMGGSLDRLIIVNIANAYASCPAGSGIRWSVHYEVVP